MPADPFEEPFPPSLHAIRLQGPWRFEWHPCDGSVEHPQDGTIRLPVETSELPVGRRGTLKLLRRFQKPTHLDAEDQVWLLLPLGCSPEYVRLNAVPLPCERRPSARVVCDLTPCLQRSNELVLEFVIDRDAPFLPSLEQPVLLGILSASHGTSPLQS